MLPARRSLGEGGNVRCFDLSRLTSHIAFLHSCLSVISRARRTVVYRIRTMYIKSVPGLPRNTIAHTHSNRHIGRTVSKKILPWLFGIIALTVLAVLLLTAGASRRQSFSISEHTIS